MSLCRVVLLCSFPIAALLCGTLLCGEPPAKLPLPSDADQAEALQIAKEVYGKDVAQAKTKPEKQTLAQKLLAKAKETEDGSANRYILLRLARDIATQAADGQTAFQAIDAMAATFQVDDLPMKLAVLTKFTSVATLPPQHKAIAEEALKLTKQAISGDHFEIAGELAKLALAEARKANDKDVLAQARDQVTKEAELAKAYEDTQKATAQLEKEPTDPAANLIVGKYKCFAKGDWDGGLVMLALGNDETLKALAQREIQGAEKPSEQARLGDDWWSLADKQEGVDKKQVQRRAAYWYSKALPGLSGMAKDKLQKRIEEVGFLGPAIVSGNSPTILLHEQMQEFTWSAKAPAVKMIHKSKGFCLLSCISGAFAGAGEKVRLTIGEDGFWYLTGKAAQPSVTVQAVSPSINEFQGESAIFKEFTWTAKAPAVKMIHKSKGFCFLSGIGGAFAGGGERVRLTIGEDGFWYLAGKAAQPSVTVQAISVQAPAFPGKSAIFKEFTWTAKAPAVKMIHKSKGFCFLSGVGGAFAGTGERVLLEIGEDGFWYLTGKAAQPSVAVQAIAIQLKE
jgi:hypothetical protein